VIFDTDDLHETNHRLDLLTQLKEANPAFRMTAFVVPGLCSDEFLDGLPEWIECAGHGWLHGGESCNDPREAAGWSYEVARGVLEALPERLRGGWKSPGWQVSDGTYEALEELGWWIADHPDNDGRRPAGIPTHVCGSGDHLHTHVQNVCGNGLEELFPELLRRVRDATSFELVSEAVEPWQP
jgi:hypothetical protein